MSQMCDTSDASEKIFKFFFKSVSLKAEMSATCGRHGGNKKLL
jgi:hypothetical protein